MKTSRPLRRGATALAALALVVAGCGSDGDTTTTAAAAAAAATTVAEATTTTAAATTTVAATVDASTTTAAAPAGGRVMNDAIGEVEVPAEAERIATTAPAFTTSVLLLGGADKLVALEENYGKNEWIKQKYPALAGLPVVFAANQTDVEQLLDQKPDLVLYAARYGEGTLRQLQDLGIAAISGEKDSDLPGYDHLNWVRDNQLYFGKAIGGVQLEKATTYAAEFTDIRARIEERTKGLTDDQRPTVVQLSAAGKVLQANDGSAIGQELITMAGGINAAASATGESMGPSGQTQIDPEQLLSWNPEILLVDSPAIRDAIASDPVLASLKAVEGNRVYVIPNGAMAWAYNGPEEYLAMQFFAKAIHPELFADLDLEKATTTFYDGYFGFEITDADLAHLFDLADGQRVADVFVR
ncbi:MAG: ABC transporter substrate-binding protein [Ilumatobacteraceae bacterium]